MARRGPESAALSPAWGKGESEGVVGLGLRGGRARGVEVDHPGVLPDWASSQGSATYGALTSRNSMAASASLCLIMRPPVG